MGGSGGGSFSYNPSRTKKLVQEQGEKASSTAFGSEIASLLGELLSSYNHRDVDMVQNRLSDIKDALEDVIDGSVDQLFGGSVAKHTYVDGMSDVDSLILINDSGLGDSSPQEAILKIQSILKNKLDPETKIHSGQMAVTLEYSDGMQIQLLPALEESDGHFKVPSTREDKWSKIRPMKFQEALTKRNSECGNKLVPTVKLAKAIIGQLPDSQRLSGYHVESLAISIFRNYDGEKTTSAMLSHFFSGAKSQVLKPLRDSSGQSIHVDESLGAADSSPRQSASHLLGRIERRIRNATAAESIEQWRALFGLDS